MSLRALMEHVMVTELFNVNESSRYKSYFYEPREERTKRDRVLNSINSRNKINVLTLKTLSDADFLAAYRIFEHRYNTWM